ncbi:hypothetical protein EPN81_01885 [Patescibacteria group bacterium]|nr:MAG: hypothetical protein EPN81_01885 [Patescibacteria group bacterium]
MDERSFHVQLTKRHIQFVNDLRTLAGFLDGEVPVEVVRMLGLLRFSEQNWPALLMRLRREDLLRDGTLRRFGRHGTFLLPRRKLDLNLYTGSLTDLPWTLRQLSRLARHVRYGNSPFIHEMLHLSPDELAARRGETAQKETPSS